MDWDQVMQWPADRAVRVCRWLAGWEEDCDEVRD
jgi:hypothetical protein